MQFKSCLLSSLALVAVLPALAKDIETASRIDAVTLFPDAAQPTRVAEIDLPAGVSRVVLTRLPVDVDPQNFQVSGQGDFAVGAIETDIEEAAQPDRSFNDPAIRKLQDQVAQVDSALEVLAEKQGMAKAYGAGQREVWIKNDKSNDPEFQKKVWQLVAETMAATEAEKQKLAVRKRDLNDQIAKLEAQQSGRSADASTLRVSVALEAKAATHARLAFSYRVKGSSWTPAYEARLDTGKGKPRLELVRRVFVKNATGEDWSDVAVTISTVHSASGTTPPVLLPAIADLSPPPGAQKFSQVSKLSQVSNGICCADGETSAQRRDSGAGIVEAFKPGAAPPAAYAEAVQQAEAYQAVFHAPGRFSLANNGAQKALRLSTQVADASLVERIAPALDARAFLVAHFVNGEGAPLGAGPAQLYLDGMFIGQSALPAIAPGDGADLAFGADNRVTVSYAPMRRNEDKAGLFGGSRTDTREFKTVVRNLHDFPVAVEASDRMPYAENTDLSIELLPQTTEPTEKDPDGRRGVLAWRFELAPQKTKEIVFGYKITWPADRQLLLRAPLAQRPDTPRYSSRGGGLY